MPERQILSVCRDDQPARARTAMLTQAGYQVRTADTTQAFDLLVGQRFDAVVLAENLPRREKVFLAGISREHWGTPVVLISPPDSDPDINADIRVDSSHGGDALLGALATLLPRQANVGSDPAG